MSRKDFELIASTIHDMDDINETIRQHIAETFAHRLASTNPNFNASRFIDACMGR